MNLRAKIAVAAGVLLLAGCRELPRYFAGDTTIARAGGKDLRLGDVRSVVPQGLSGDDSAAFMKVYIDRWVLKQLKLQEAETLFSSSAGDIDKMVEEYRQALLIRQLDQHYVDRSIDTVFTADEIAAYYNAHKADFKLDRTIVKGRIVRFGEGYRQAAKLKTLMGARSEAQQQDFRDICEKNDFTVDDFREILRAGADKISINSSAVKNPDLVNAAAEKYGSQCVVVAIDARANEQMPSGFEVYVAGGRTPTGKDTVAWAKEVYERGAGEILLTSMDKDGTKSGFDLPLTKAITDVVGIPVIASGGCGSLAHFSEVFEQTGWDAALAASLFHYRELTVKEVKEHLREKNIPVRL